MFFRPGGSSKRINTQYDSVYVDFVNGATDWLPVYFGNWVAVHVARASIMFSSPASSVVSKNVVSPEAEVLLEMKSFGGQKDEEAWPLDYWQNVVVATGRRVDSDGWVRLRLLSINNADGTGVAMGLQVNRTNSVRASA